jgi:hypothetical protein
MLLLILDHLKICDVTSSELTVELDLQVDIHIEENRVNDKIQLSLRQDDFTVLLLCDNEQEVTHFISALGKGVIEVKSAVLEGAQSGMQALMDILDHVPFLPAAEEEEILQAEHAASSSPSSSSSAASAGRTAVRLAVPPKPPPMKIVILVVGTRGDVGPFVNLALGLKEQGHDVRIGTHLEYRAVVMREGLKFYPLAGDPRKLSEYMVKTGGRLLPDLTCAEERAAIPEKMQMLKEITHSTWGACTQPDPEDEAAEPFVVGGVG